METAFSLLSKKLKRYSDEKLFIEICKNKGFLTLCADFMRMRLDKGLTPDDRIIQTYRGKILWAQTKYRSFYIVYSWRRFHERKKMGLKVDRVDLKETGTFHNSIKAVRRGLEIVQIGQTKKKDGDILDNVEYTDIFGFSDEDIKNAIDYLLNKGIFIDSFKKVTGFK